MSNQTGSSARYPVEPSMDTADPTATGTASIPHPKTFEQKTLLEKLEDRLIDEEGPCPDLSEQLRSTS